jgi:hypothetical protein
VIISAKHHCEAATRTGLSVSLFGRSPLWLHSQTSRQPSILVGALASSAEVVPEQEARLRLYKPAA